MAVVTCQRRREKWGSLTVPEMWMHARVYVKACLSVFREVIWEARRCTPAKKYLPRRTELNFCLGEKKCITPLTSKSECWKVESLSRNKSLRRIDHKLHLPQCMSGLWPTKGRPLDSRVSTWEEINFSKWSWGTAPPQKNKIAPACPRWEKLKRNRDNLKNEQSKCKSSRWTFWPLTLELLLLLGYFLRLQVIFFEPWRCRWRCGTSPKDEQQFVKHSNQHTTWIGY